MNSASDTHSGRRRLRLPAAAWPLLSLVLLIALAVFWVQGDQRIRASASAVPILLQWGALLGLVAIAKLLTLWRASTPDGTLRDRAIGKSIAMLLIGAAVGLAAGIVGIIAMWLRGQTAALGIGTATLLAAWHGTCFFALLNVGEAELTHLRRRP